MRGGVLTTPPSVCALSVLVDMWWHSWSLGRDGGVDEATSEVLGPLTNKVDSPCP